MNNSLSWRIQRFVCYGLAGLCMVGAAAIAADYGWEEFRIDDNNAILLCVPSDKCKCTPELSTNSSLNAMILGTSPLHTQLTPQEAAAAIPIGIPFGHGVLDTECTWILISTGSSRVDSLLGSGFFRIWADTPTASLWTPQGMRYVRGGYGIHGISFEKTAAGVPQQVNVINPQGLMAMFKFANNESIGLPWGSTKDEDATRLHMVDAEGWATTNNPAYYDLYTGGGDRYRFVAATNSADYLQLVKYRSVRGREEDVSNWGSEVVWDSYGVLRQVKAPMGLADIIVSNNHKYAINFYKISDIQSGKDTNGYYQAVTGAVPLTVWTFENPEPSTMRKLRVSNASGSKTNVADFVYTDASKEWQLTTGGGLRTKSTDQLWSDDRTYMISTKVVKGPDNVVVSKETQKYYAYPWLPQRIEDVLDPDGLALKTQYDYYSNSAETNHYTKLKSEKYPGGGWVFYDYDASCRKSLEIRPWKDSAYGTNPASARAVYYSYTPVAVGDSLIFNDQRPRTVTETVLGTVVSKTYYAYVTNALGELSEIVEQCVETNAAYGATNNLRSVTTYYGTNVSPFKISLPKSQVFQDGQINSYDCEYGTFHASNAAPATSWFEVDPNGSDVRRTVTGGTTNSPLGIAYKTGKSVTIFDPYSHQLFAETYVYVGGTDYERTSWAMPEYDDYFHVVKVRASNGTQTDAAWGSNCCGKESDKDASGIEHTYDYDLLNRLITATKKGTNSPAGDFKTETTRDAADRTLTTKISGGSLSLVTASNTYNVAGQMVSSVDSLGLTNTYSQTGGGLTNTVIQPGGLTNVTVSYADGRAKYTTLNGAIESWSDYGVNNDGSQWIIVYSGPAGTNSPVWSKTTTDLLGRTIRTERPGYGGAVATTLSFFDSANHLRESAFICGSISNSTLYEYNELSEQIRAGLDVNGNGALDLASMDRIIESDSFMEKDASNDWWQVSMSKLYAKDNDATLTTNSIQKTRLTGLGGAVPGGSLASATVSLDILGNQTISTTTIDRDNKTVTQTVDYPDSTNDAVSVSVNGLLVSSRSKTGIETTFGHDALERQISATDPRTGTAVTHFNDKGQVDWAENAASNRTSYVYEESTGRQISRTDAISGTVYTAYNVQGQPIGTWGATYPVFYEFDDFNRMSAMYTLRDTNVVVTSYSSFTSQPSAFDKTRWLYEEATGLLTNKLYADTNGVSYTYTADGKLASRLWARGILTTYRYEPGSGAMTNMDYSDSTPDVSFILDRLGRQKTVLDATGSRTFTYNDALQLAAETNVMGSIERQYDSQGRSAGFEFWNGGTRAVASAYGYSDVGRFASVSSSLPSMVSYSYLQNADLLSGWTEAGSGVTVARSYEANRNLLTSVSNGVGATMIARFDYQNDALGRRTRRIDTATVVLTNDFGYNLRSELITALMGTNAFAWDLDNIGNRNASTANAEQKLYTANSLNQYTQITNGGLQTLSYDLDGNMLTWNGWTYSWNGENQLAGASNASVIAAYSYDYQGRRYRKIVNGVTNTFLYDGWNLTRSVTLSNDGVVTNDYVWGMDLSGSLQGAGGIGGLLCVIRNGTPYYPYADGNGNITDYVDTNGTVVAHREFDAYGNTLVAAGAMVNEFHFWFSSKYLDSETGLYYYGLRFYHSGIGRWMSRDPLDEQSQQRDLSVNDKNVDIILIKYRNSLRQMGVNSDVSGYLYSQVSITEEATSGHVLYSRLPECPNLYGFVLNNPQNNLDPDGREIITIAITTYTIAKGVSHLIMACYECYECVKCKNRAYKMIGEAAKEFEARDKVLEFHLWLKNAKPGSECADLCADCGKEAVLAAKWIVGGVVIKYGIKYSK